MFFSRLIFIAFLLVFCTTAGYAADSDSSKDESKTTEQKVEKVDKSAKKSVETDNNSKTSKEENSKGKGEENS